jgi:hypothetical protein
LDSDSEDDDFDLQGIERSIDEMDEMEEEYYHDLDVASDFEDDILSSSHSLLHSLSDSDVDCVITSSCWSS